MMASGILKKTTWIFILLLLTALLLAAGGSAYLYYQLRQSLPILEGELSSTIVTAPTSIDRDEMGTVTITGSSRLDLAAALGFCHAQERFFNMDLLRRKAAGELSGLVGSAALPVDREARIHRFRERARKFAGSLPAGERELLSAYVDGVNAGLTSLEQYPFEYLLLQQEPIPWRIEDTLLVVYAMYLDLQGDYPAMEAAHGLMSDLLPAPMYEFLTPSGTEWDAPVDGEAFSTPDIPGPDVFSLHEHPRKDPPATEDQETNQELPKRVPLERAIRIYPALYASVQSHDFQPLHAGSNNWVVSGSFTSHGQPIVANDMHLGLMVPNIWFRVSLVMPGADGDRRITGLTLPGTPLVIAGSNGKIAWGFTNSQGDWLDLIILEPGTEEGTYLTPDGPLPITRVEEKILCSDGTEDTLEIEETVWGPVVKTDHLGRKLVARWVAHDPAGMNMELAALEGVSSVTEAIGIAAHCGLPAQNFVVADREGNIGWTIVGPIPRRVGYSGEVPRSWASGECHWDGFLAPEEYPRIINPAGGRIWTANARVVSGEMLAKVGFGGYALGARAKQIRDDLFALDKASEKDMLKVQLDHRALFLERWRNLLLDEVLQPGVLDGSPRLQEVRKLLEDWGGKASVDSAGYRIVRAYRNQVAKGIFEGLTARCVNADDQFAYYLIRGNEGPLWKLVKQKPWHLLPAGFESWNEMMLNFLEQVIEEAEKDPAAQGEAGLGGWTWGVRNTAAIRHPLSPFLPVSFLSRYLDAPPDQLPGDSNMPRAQGPGFGASERMAVSPGMEQQGILHMPGGQSGHPLSPFYLSGHEDWVQGNPSPFLPGEAVHTLLLKP